LNLNRKGLTSSGSFQHFHREWRPVPVAVQLMRYSESNID
jgi:hypothetical protein